jgi:hypothetical protein
MQLQLDARRNLDLQDLRAGLPDHSLVAGKAGWTNYQARGSIKYPEKYLRESNLRFYVLQLYIPYCVAFGDR